MQQLGPYLVLTADGEPDYWGYFSIDSASKVSYYTSHYGKAVDWCEIRLSNTFYVYDPHTKKPICYSQQGDSFYQIPLQAGNRVSVVKEFKNGAFQLARLRAKDLEIKVESYIELQADLVLEKEPELPLLPAEDAVLSVVYATVDIETARQSLLVKKLVKINSKEEGVLESGVLFVWEDSDDWYFKTFLLGEEIRGKLDSRLDGLIIAKAQDSSGEIKLSELEMQEFSRCYLKLTPAHQANITAIFRHVWPLSVDMSTDEQIAVCRTILNAKSLSSAEFSDEDRLDILDALLIDEFISLHEDLDAIINPANASPEISQIANNAIAVISASNEDGQFAARETLTENCRKLQTIILKKILQKLCALSSAELTRECAEIYSNDQLPEPLASLIQLFNQLEILKDVVSFRAVVEHQNLSEVIEALKLLKATNLLTGESAQKNFNAVVKNRRPLEHAKTRKRLQEVGLLSDINAQVNCKRYIFI